MKVHFQGAPDRISRMRKLFPSTLTARVRYAEPDRQKLQILRDAKGNWIRSAWRAVMRRSA